MDAIAAGARVSKPTLYRYFQNKDALFADILRDLTRQRIWNDIPEDALQIAIVSREELATTLLAVARSVIAQLMTPTYLGLLRVLIAEVPRFPHLAQLFRASVLEEGPRLLSPVFDRARAAGVVTLPHAGVAARLFVGPLLLYVFADGLISTTDVPRQPTLEDLTALVDLFITAIT